MPSSRAEQPGRNQPPVCRKRLRFLTVLTLTLVLGSATLPADPLPAPGETTALPPTADNPVMLARNAPKGGAIEILESGKPVLRYNYATVEPGEVLKRVSEGNLKYARPRSDYIHPLFGLDGRELTRDWAVDHPHHRGIYWAWPEVEQTASPGPVSTNKPVTERGDLHALQRIFARPTGRVRVNNTAAYAEIEAENQWYWEERPQSPVVRELTLIRAYRAENNSRVVDLAFLFTGMEPGVTIARRETDKYGGLNIRLATPQAQEIIAHTDATGKAPLRAWSDLSGAFPPAGGGREGLMVLQHRSNPDYPGDWIQYPELSWCQPTFPSSGERYPLTPGKALVLRYRLWIHGDVSKGEIDKIAAGLWDTYHASKTRLPEFTLLAPDRRGKAPSKP